MMARSAARGDEKILVIGNSHTDALAAAGAKTSDDRFNFVNIASFFDPENRRNKELRPELREYFNPKHIYCSFGGSEHNVFGLLEAPAKFDFAIPGATGLMPSRQIVTYNMIRATLGHAMKRHLAQIIQLRDMFGQTVTHICSPPPFRTLGDKSTLPRVFQEKLYLGVAPAAVRKKIYITHSSIVRDFCNAHDDVNFLETPARSRDPDGYLKPEFCSADPTHANAAYGRLVLDDILEAVHGTV